MTRRGFPHSDIPGSKLVCSSPRLIAAYRVLHRLLAPRHSPCALSSLTIGIGTDTSARRLGRARATVPLPNPHIQHCVCSVDRKKLPFAGYSVVKELRQPFSRRSRPPTATAKFSSRSCALPRSTISSNSGGEYRSRTGDLLVANQALSQLS